jgi:hypothetical protein
MLNRNKKLRVGIDINEVLRARWLQFDRFYVQEFGEDGIPEQPYAYDLFKNYPWKDVTEQIKDLKEPEDMPENINPLDYQHDEKLGEAPADAFIFKSVEEKHYTAKEVYNRFMYEDYVFEIHASAPIMYKGMDLHLKNFYSKYKNTVDLIVVSKDENEFSIPSTLFFLSKMTSRFSNYLLGKNNDEIWDNIDVLITTDPDFLESIPLGKEVIKLKRPYNLKSGDGSITPVLQVNDLLDNEEFEKIIKYIKPE